MPFAGQTHEVGIGHAAHHGIFEAPAGETVPERSADGGIAEAPAPGVCRDPARQIRLARSKSRRIVRQQSYGLLDGAERIREGGFGFAEAGGDRLFVVILSSDSRTFQTLFRTIDPVAQDEMIFVGLEDEALAAGGRDPARQAIPIHGNSRESIADPGDLGFRIRCETRPPWSTGQFLPVITDEETVVADDHGNLGGSRRRKCRLDVFLSGHGVS